MKTSLRKLVATVSGLAIAAVLPATALMASAEGTTLSLATASETVKAGDTITVSVNIAGNEGWDLIDGVITYDEGLTPVQSYSEDDEDFVDAINGSAMGAAMASINLEAEDGILVGVISSSVIKRNGTLFSIDFKVADDVKAGAALKVAMKLNDVSESIVENGQNVGKTPRVEAGTVLNAEVKVAGEEPPTPVVDRTALDKAITDAEAVLKDGKVYTAETLKAVEDALTAAKAVPADADQATVDAAAKALNDAVAALEEIVIPGDLDTEAFDEALAKAVAAALLEDNYTAESFAAFDAAMDAALAIVDKEDLTQDDIDAATKAINDALALLVEKNTTPSTDPTNPTNPTDPTVPSDVTDPTDPTDPIVVPGDTTTPGSGAQTGESTTLFVLALVLMAGSAVALVGMKKKVFSK